MSNMCSLRNSCCKTYQCCHFCNKKCDERCSDDLSKCKFKTDKEPEIGKPWNFKVVDVSNKKSKK